MEEFEKLILSVLLGIVLMLVFAWAGSVIWAWFLVPAGIMSLPYTAFIGAAFLVSMANLYTVSITEKAIEENKKSSWAFSTGIIVVKILLALLLVGIAGIYHALLF